MRPLALLPVPLWLTFGFVGVRAKALGNNMSLSIGIEDQLTGQHTGDLFPFRHSHYASRCQRIYKLVSENVSHPNSVKLARFEAL
jgi:hypothetical protein